MKWPVALPRAPLSIDDPRLVECSLIAHRLAARGEPIVPPIRHSLAVASLLEVQFFIHLLILFKEDSRMIKAFKVLLVLAAVSSAPFTFDFGSGRVTANNAECQEITPGGSCCGGSGTCYPGNCSQKSCSTDNAYWKSDGPC